MVLTEEVYIGLPIPNGRHTDLMQRGLGATNLTFLQDAIKASMVKSVINLYNLISYTKGNKK